MALILKQLKKKLLFLSKSKFPRCHLLAGPKQQFSLGLLPANEENKVDEESVRFFTNVAARRNAAPASYSAVSLGE